MKYFLLLLMILSSALAIADDHFRCENVSQINGYRNTEMTIKRSFFSKKVNSVELVNELEANSGFKPVENPFMSSNAKQLEVDAKVVKETLKLNFVGIRNTSNSNRIAIDEELLAGKNSGYAYYYSKDCILMSCSTVSYYFKCERY